MFYINMVGYNFIEKSNFKVNRQHGSNDFLFLYFKTPITILVNSQIQTIPENSCILYSPSSPQLYYNSDGGFTNDYFHFTISNKDDLIDKLNLPFNTPFIVDDFSYVRLTIESLEQEHLIKDTLHIEIIDAMLKTFFIKISRQIDKNLSRETSPYIADMYSKFKKVRLEILSNYEKEWDVELMANIVNLSTSRFSTLYKSFFFVSPKVELQSERLKMAKYLLRSTSLSIEEISKKVGYNNLFHFSKQFKKILGKSPSQCR